MSALAFLRQCIPKQYHKEIEGFWRLDDDLNSLAQWCSDSKIHTEQIEQQLHSMHSSNSFEEDCSIISKQISQLQHCIEIDDTFFMTIANICTHSSKYYEASLYNTILTNLNMVAARNRYLSGRKNYILLFIENLYSL